MVVSSHYYYALTIGNIDFLHPVLSSSAFYLHAFLKITRGRKMFKKTILAVLAIFLLVIISFALKEISNNNPFHIIKYNKLHDKLSNDNKILVYRVDFQGLIPTGDATLENKGEELYLGRKVYHLSARADILNFYSRIYNAQAQVDSYIDAVKLYTLKFTQTLILPNKPKDEKVVLYDQEKNFMELKGVKRQILAGSQDPLSAIFYLQHQILEPGKVFDININTNQKNYQLYAKVIGRELYTLDSKKVGVWVLEATIRRRDKNPYHKTTMKLWLLDNPSKVPIFIRTVTNIGIVTARLIDIK